MNDNREALDLKPVPLGLNDLVATMQQLQAVEAARMPALRAKLKHLQRLGCPAESNTGTGRAARYGASQLVEVSIVMELTRVGIRAEEAVALITAERWIIGWVRRQFGLGREATERMTFLTIESGREDAHSVSTEFQRRVELVDSDGVMLPLARIAGHERRIQSINVTGLARALGESLIAAGFDPSGLEEEIDDLSGVHGVEPYQF